MFETQYHSYIIVQSKAHSVKAFQSIITVLAITNFSQKKTKYGFFLSAVAKIVKCTHRYKKKMSPEANHSRTIQDGWQAQNSV